MFRSAAMLKTAFDAPVYATVEQHQAVLDLKEDFMKRWILVI